ncbi:MAG: hypothetical protein MUO23_15340, partial [Anaerolineales bacterium]|nr:hypothetical protein [Anaerolineales bacterium]
LYNEGISKEGDVLDLGVGLGVVEKRGSFYTYSEQRIGQGRENARQFLRDNPQVAEEIEGRIRGSFAPAAALGAADEDAELVD